MKKLLHLIIGFLCGISAVLACSDDSPPKADAASCDCPAAEAPLPGRVVEVIEARMLPPSTEFNGRASGGAGCPENSILLTGGCMGGTGQAPDVVLEQSSPTPRENGNPGTSWNCRWRNNTNQPVEVRGIVRCLVPAP